MIDMVGFIWSNLSYWYYCYDKYDGNGLIKFKRLKLLIWLKWCFSLEDKLRWMFSLYDINKDGVLSPTEIRFVKLPIICIKCRKRVCRIFSLYMYYFTNRNKICRILFSAMYYFANRSTVCRIVFLLMYNFDDKNTICRIFFFWM